MAVEVTQVRTDEIIAKAGVDCSDQLEVKMQFWFDTSMLY